MAQEIPLPKKEESEELFKVHETENSPFFVIERNGKFNIVVGNQIASSKEFNCLFDALEYIDSKPWELIGALTFIINEKVKGE